MSKGRQDLLNEIAAFCDQSGILDPLDGAAAFMSIHTPVGFPFSGNSPKTKPAMLRVFNRILKDCIDAIKQDPDSYEGSYSRMMEIRWRDGIGSTPSYIRGVTEFLNTRSQ